MDAFITIVISLPIKTFARRLDNFRGRSKLDKKNKFSVKTWLSLKCFSGDEECSFEGPRNRCRQKVEKFPKLKKKSEKSLSLTCENGKNTYNFFEKSNFLPRFPVDMWNSVLALMLEFFQQKTEKVRSKNENHKKIQFFQKKLNKNIPRDTLNTVFTTELFLFVVQNGQGKVSSIKKFSSNFFYLEVKCTFLDRAEKRLPEGPVFSCQSPQKNWKLK